MSASERLLGASPPRPADPQYVHQQWNGTPCPKCLRPLRCVGGHLSFAEATGKSRAFATYACENGHRYQAERHDSAAGSRMSDLWEVGDEAAAPTGATIHVL